MRSQYRGQLRLGLALVLGLLLISAGLVANRNTTEQRAYAQFADMGGTTSQRASARVDRADHADVSPPLRTIRPIAPTASKLQEAPENPPLLAVGKTLSGPDPALQRFFSPLVMPAPIQNFEGQPNLWSVFPPDTNGDVGRNNYIQMVNLGFQIFTKTGVSLYGPANNNTLWTGFGGVCETTNNGDPIVLYDPLADRWLLSQFAFVSTSTPTHQCFAISTSPDPLGSYYRYDFQTSPAPTTFEDYPHIGVWPDAYYMTTNEFPGGVGSGGGAFAFDRNKMLMGDPSATALYFHTASGGNLPSDLDGAPPPAGSPNYFLGLGPTTTQLQEYRFHADFTNPLLSTFLGPFLITVPAYNQTLCSGARGACIDQPGTTVKLEAITDRLMYRLQYRNFPGDHETLVVNHTVNANGGNPGVAGIRWYEIRDPAGTPVAFQAGTYAPDGDHRWMGSAAMDHTGDIAIGFSRSSTVTFPSILYAGRLVTDPLNLLSQGEATLITGGGSQTGTQNANDGRWGDYSMLAVDPVDDCTYWYTQEFIRVTTVVGWNTRIGSFRFPNCTAGGTATPVPSATGTPPTATATPSVTPTLCPGSQVITGSITSSDPLQNGRLVRSGGTSTCAVPVTTCPGPSGDNTLRHYDSYTFTNTSGSPQCITVSVDARGCSTGAVYSVAYLNSYDPTNLCLNFLAQAGQLAPVETYSFTVPAGATFVVVVHEASANEGCVSYTLTVNGCLAGAITPTATAPATGTPTVTPVLPTVTLPLPTLTLTVVPPTLTATAVPPTLTATVVPPTLTATVVPPTLTRTVVPPTLTATVVPPTLTATVVPPTLTRTAVPPTLTATIVPPTLTATVSNTATSVPSATRTTAPTNTTTVVASATRTTAPSATRTTAPTATRSPATTATATPACPASTPTRVPTPAFTPAPGCSSTPPDGVLSATIVDHPNTTEAIFTNHSQTCSYQIGLASYKRFDNNINHQQLYDYQLAVIPPNSTLTLTVNNPTCAYQADAFYGSLLESFAGGVRYGQRRLDDTVGHGHNYCTNQCNATPTPPR